jgi:hypothetical protein
MTLFDGGDETPPSQQGLVSCYGLVVSKPIFIDLSQRLLTIFKRANCQAEGRGLLNSTDLEL